MKRLFLSFLALFFPWFVFVLKDNPGAALVVLVMQASIIGWLPATIWAWRVAHGKSPTQENEK